VQILLANDDGIHSPGLSALRDELVSLGDVQVVAPASEQSGVGLSITYLHPLTAREEVRDGEHFGWAVAGSPADCVKLGMMQFCKTRPDLVVSGINSGANVGINVLYSGTVAAAIEGANTGHMVFSTVHANDTITALFRILELGVEPFMIANSISAILGQRLCRKLCSDCKEAYAPNPELLKQAGLPASKIDKFYRPPKTQSPPCPTCGGLGYRGRIGVFEVLIITDRIRDMIREKAAASAIKAEARKNGMLMMKEEGLRLVVKGVTAIDELLRVVK